MSKRERFVAAQTDQPPADQLGKTSSDAEMAIFAAELGACPELDVHGHDPESADIEIERFLFQAYKNGTEAVKIIHGKGKQILADSISRMLANHPLSAYARRSNNPAEANAVTYVALMKRPHP